MVCGGEVEEDSVWMEIVGGAEGVDGDSGRGMAGGWAQKGGH